MEADNGNIIKIKNSSSPAPDLSLRKLGARFRQAETGAPGVSRTRNHLLRREVLYPLSYRRKILLSEMERLTKDSSIELQALDVDIVQYSRRKTKANQVSGERDSNPRPSPWKGDILPLNYPRKLNKRRANLFTPASVASGGK